MEEQRRRRLEQISNFENATDSLGTNDETAASTFRASSQYITSQYGGASGSGSGGTGTGGRLGRNETREACSVRAHRFNYLNINV